MVPAENASVLSAAERCPNCSSPAGPEVDVTKVVVLGVVLVVFAVFGVLGNILVILSVLFHHHWRSVTHYFIANLAAADLLLSSAVLPFSATSEALGRWVFGRTFCGVWAALDVLCCTASILSLCVISIDRYLAVSYPLRYPAIATGRRGLTAVAALWGLSAAISVGPLFGWKEPDPEDETVCRITEEPGYALFSALGSFYVPLVIILAMYCRVYTVVKRETNTIRKGSEGEGVETEGVVLRIHRGHAAQTGKQEDDEGLKRHKRSTFPLPRLLKFTREEKAAKTLGIVVGCFILCWLPFFLVLPIGVQEGLRQRAARPLPEKRQAPGTPRRHPGLQLRPRDQSLRSLGPKRRRHRFRSVLLLLPPPLRGPANRLAARRRRSGSERANPEEESAEGVVVLREPDASPTERLLPVLLLLLLPPIDEGLVSFPRDQRRSRVTVTRRSCRAICCFSSSRRERGAGPKERCSHGESRRQLC
ncbi:hypothetical protein F2P81_015710 [Scophthalmus maximus]|uniref:G-protein coupled receptors family 1 profile domain-containing protein n=1 Tax=Scophthalmus maximus TaxID=52904 RepID=A0A6A4SF34_SCOMX|nr:hypothetical protein F2P81_015710 [Scophthalmus maximus]